MPTLSASNRSQLSYKLEGTYPTNFGVPQGGNGTYLNMTGEDLDYAVKTEQSKQIRYDRQVLDVVQVGASSQGGFNFEQQFKEYDPMIEGVMQSTFTEYGVNGLGAAIADVTLASLSITAGAATSGASIFTSLEKGQWFSVKPPGGASTAVKNYFKGRAFRLSTVTAPTTTVLTLDPATPINTSIAGTDLDGASIYSARMTNASVMKSYTLEAGHLDVTQFRQYTGMIPSKMDLKLAVGSIVTGRFEFMGKSMNLLQASSMGTPVASMLFTPANATRGVFDVFEGGAALSATTYVKSADLMLDNSLRIQDAVGVFGAAGIAAGQIKFTGKLEVYFADEVMYNKLLSGAESSFSLPIMDVEGNGYVFYIPRLKYTSAKMGTQGLDQDNMLSMEFSAIMDNTPTSSTYQKTAAIYRV